MPIDAWVAVIGLALGIIGSVVGTVWAVATQVGKAITRFELVGTQQAAEIKEVKEALEKLGDVVTLVAVQKEEIRSIRDTQGQNTKRTDETFTRIFNRLDSIPTKPVS